MTDAFPREQLGLAMGTNTMVAAVGLVIGPVLGGALILLSWHWVFWFNVPFAALGCLWAGGILHELAKPDSVRGFDLLGTVTFVIGLTGLVSGSPAAAWRAGATRSSSAGSSSAPCCCRSSCSSSAGAARRCST